MNIFAIDPGNGLSKPTKRTGCGKKGVSVLPAASDEERKARRKSTLDRALKKYREANRELLNKKQRESRKTVVGRAKNAERQKAYRAQRPELFASYEARRVRPDDYREKATKSEKAWRSENKDKVAEYAHKRDGKRLSRLDPGSIKSIGDRQKWRCPVCRSQLGDSGYHMDHIVPLALGGEHHRLNIQLLCPACNLSKGKKDPIKFMQEKGMLL